MPLHDEALRPEEISEQVELLCKHLPPKEGDLLRYLTAPDRREEFSRLTGKNILVAFDREQLKKQGRTAPPSEDEKKQGYDRARQHATKLARALREHYRESFEGPDRIKIVLADDPNDHEHRYEPQITRFAPTPHSEKFWPVGNSAAALRYVTDQIPNLNRLEETIVRWVEQPKSLFGKAIIGAFLRELEKSELLYRAVLSSVTDPIVYEPKGLRDALAKRLSNGTSEEENTKVYRLLHDSVFINFSILYYFESRADFHARTQRVEVLFGYCVHERYEVAASTMVYRTQDPKMVRDFREIFNALRSRDFSRKLDPRRPDHFLHAPHKSDVLATFPILPKEELLKRIRVSGSAETGSWETLPRPAGYWEEAPHISICVSALKLMDDLEFKEELKAALDRGVKVTLAMWGPGTFITSRIEAIGIDNDDAQREIEGMRSLARFLGEHENLTVLECTGSFGSISVFWLDDVILFSPYWIGKDVSSGPHFLIAADSTTGDEIRNQYKRMLDTSRSLSGRVEPKAQND